MSHATIIAAIDAAIETWAGLPKSITAQDGRTYVYHSLDELIRARQHYARLDATGGGKGFKIGVFKAPSAR